MAVEDHSDDEGRRPLKEQGGGGDEDLTSLSWLQDADLLKDFRVGEGEGSGEDSPAPPSSPSCCTTPEEHAITQQGDEECEQNVEPMGAHTPYDPALHAHSKPPFSFSCLIFMAIEASPRKALPVKDIYGWILARFPYFQGAPTGWKNSVRHNLSLSKCFRKVDKEKGQNVGKGSLWCIDPEFRPNLLQALQKAPSMANLEFSHFINCHTPPPESEIKPCLLVATQEAIQIPSPELFPFLSRRLASTMKDPEVDAAATMLTLKNGPAHTPQNASDESENDSIQNNPKFSRKRLRLKQSHHSGSKRPKGLGMRPVVTISPSEDHTYSACPEENNNNGHSALEEEGAHALMNLAEVASKRLLRKAS